MNIKEYQEVMVKYSMALDILETTIKLRLKKYEYENNEVITDHIKSRLKTCDSAINKLIKKGYEINAKNLVRHVHDIAGIRIVCPFLSDVYKVVDVLKDNPNFNIKEEKDYIKNPKDTGYMSYHLKVEVPIQKNDKEELVEGEIQIRTMAMDFWASLDHRLQYKLPEEIPDVIANEIYNCSVDIKEVDEKMLYLKEFISNYLSK